MLLDTAPTAPAAPAHTDHDPAPRGIAARTRGTTRGGITRLVNPSDLGEALKPFVFLDRGELPSAQGSFFGIHPHSGIATLTLVLGGALRYEDTTGAHGVVRTGGLEWMRAARGAWHDGAVAGSEPLRFFQLWLALPEALEHAPADSQSIAPDDVEADGPVTVLLGRHGRAGSRIRAPEGIDYFHVALGDGETWRYLPPPRHTVAWLAVDSGTVHAPTPVAEGELVAFDRGEGAIEVTARGAARFVFGSAIPHPHDLVTGYYSVHTTDQALVDGEQEIQRIGNTLRQTGRLR